MDSGSSQHDPPRETPQRKGSAPPKCVCGGGRCRGRPDRRIGPIGIGDNTRRRDRSIREGGFGLVITNIRNNFPILQLFPQKNRGGGKLFHSSVEIRHTDFSSHTFIRCRPARERPQPSGACPDGRGEPERTAPSKGPAHDVDPVVGQCVARRSSALKRAA